MATCPRCGEPMSGGICDNCGFPMRRFKKIVFPKKKNVRTIKWNMKSM